MIFSGLGKWKKLCPTIGGMVYMVSTSEYMRSVRSVIPKAWTNNYQLNIKLYMFSSSLNIDLFYFNGQKMLKPLFLKKNKL